MKLLLVVMADGKSSMGTTHLLGATFIISIDNGCVLDYSIKSKTCAVCNKNPNPTDEWSRNHELFCEKNPTRVVQVVWKKKGQ